MRKVVISVYSTLDGVMNPMQWTGHYSHPEHGAYQRDLLFASDALVAGRETFEIFAATWADKTSADDAPKQSPSSSSSPVSTLSCMAQAPWRIHCCSMA
jgi:hypothetical protein